VIMVKDDENLPEWPKWAYISEKVDSDQDYDWGWWTRKGDLVLHVTTDFVSGYRTLYDPNKTFEGWTDFEAFEYNPHISKEEIDSFMMETLL